MNQFVTLHLFRIIYTQTQMYILMDNLPETLVQESSNEVLTNLTGTTAILGNSLTKSPFGVPL